MKALNLRIVIFHLLLIAQFVLPAENSLFPIPEKLRDNISFWKMIYSQVSLTKGLLHDRDYPSIIYDTVTVGRLWGKELDKFLVIPKRKITNVIINIQKKDPSSWGGEEKRIAALFDSNPGALIDAENRIRFQLGQKERFVEGLKRSGAFIDTIKAILRERNLPEQLAYLPHVESSFNTKAFSKSGASGIWQFIPSTGKRYLRIDAFIDERNDPILSSIAAAKLLSLNYQKLKSWPLAVTAYNYGLSGMIRAVQNTGSHDIDTIIAQHESPIFRFASKNFYSCFLAVIEIAQEPSRYFSTIAFDKPSVNQDIKIIKSMRLSEVCRILGCTEKELIERNPFFRTGILTGQFAIPSGTTIRIDTNLSGEQIVERVAASYDTSEQMKKLGDLSADTLKFNDENKVVNNQDLDSVKIVYKKISEISFENKQLAIITVASEECIGNYAEWLGISEKEIMRVNQTLQTSHIKSGQKIKIPLTEAAKDEFLQLRFAFHKEIQRSFFRKYKITKIQTRVLKNGEVIWTLCKGTISIPIWLLECLNNDTNLNKLLPGTQINIPVIVRN